jgi:hypothetical protein
VSLTNRLLLTAVRLNEHLPVRDLGVQVRLTPVRDDVGNVGMRIPRTNDKPAASICFMLFSEIIPASATMTTSCRRWAAMNAVIVGSIIVVVSAVLPSNALTISVNPARRSAGRR